MKRCFALVISLILVLSLAACGRAERTPAMEPKSGSSSPSPVSGSAQEQPSQIQTDGPQTNPAEDLLSIAADFAENYPFAFLSTGQLFPDHFTLWKIYEEDPGAVDENGILWVSPERMAAEVELRFGISDFRLREPFWEDEYPRYVEEEGAIAFIPVGEGSRFAVELTGQEAQGEYYDYTFDIYDNFITDGHEEKTLERTVRYRFRVVETDSGRLFLQAVSAEELPREKEPAPEDEMQSYYRKYILPYYRTGLMYSTWSNPEEIDVQRYMWFYIYNESDHYWSENPSRDFRAIPADIVEDYITGYFEVAPEYLRTAENYDPASGCYLSMFTEGIGDGPGVVIERIEKDEDTWKFVCGEGAEGDRQASVTIRFVDENTFHYIAGKKISR